MTRSRIVSLILLAYVLAVGFGIEMLNSAWGDVLPEWHKYAWGDGSGYGKMRGQMGDFQTVLFLFGTWVYPFSVIAAYIFVRQALATKARPTKVGSLLCAGACLAVLGRFLWMGVFSAGIGG